MSIETNSSLPPLTIEYRDGATFVESNPPTSRDRQLQLARICMDAVSYGATITDAFPVTVGGMERLEAIKIMAKNQNQPLQYHRSDGTCGIIG